MAERNRLRVAAHECAAGRPRTNLSQEVVLLSGPHAPPRSLRARLQSEHGASNSANLGLGYPSFHPPAGAGTLYKLNLAVRMVMIGLKLNTLPRNACALPMRPPFFQVSVMH